MAVTQKMGRKLTDKKTVINPEHIILKKDIPFPGENDIYNIYADQIVGMGGESQVFMAKRQSDNSDVLAKIYTDFAYGGVSQQNRNAVVKFLRKNTDYKTTHILPLYDAGDIMIEGADGEKYRHPIDILPFCPDGHLVKCSFEEIREKLIPNILGALNSMHKENLVHRDIKPENIYMFNGEFVLGDFGTAGFISVGDSLVTSTRRGTVGYAAPEVSNGYIVPATDFFAFGCTIATLYNGSHVYSHLVDRNNEGEFLFALKKNGLPLDCPTDEKTLQILVDALTIYEYENRACFDDVNLWLSNPYAFSEKWSSKKNSFKESNSFEYMFKKNTYTSKEDLTKAFVENWTEAKGEFFRGGTNNSKFHSFLIRTNQPCGDESGKILEEFERDKTGRYDADLGLAKMLHYFNSDESANSKCPIYWCGYQFDTLPDLAIKMSEEDTDQAVFKHMLTSGFLSWKLENTNGYDSNESISAIKTIEKISKEYPSLAYYLLMYRLAPNGYFDKTSPDEVFERITQNNDGFYSSVKELLENDKPLAQLIDLGYEDEVLKFKKGITSDFMKDVISLYLLFEAICSNKTKVREHYICYGPLSYLYWIQQNIDRYTFKSSRTKNNAESIKLVSLSADNQIEQIHKSFISLREYCQNLQDDFQNDILLNYIELDNGKEIVSDDIDAYFKEEFYGTVVPVGYMRYMNLQSEIDNTEHSGNSSYNPNSNGNEGVVWDGEHYRFSRKGF